MKHSTPTTTVAPVLSVEGLSRDFNIPVPFLRRLVPGRPRPVFRAVTDVSFEIPRGQTYALVGESGSGKSTIARMVVGLTRPTAGVVRIAGHDLFAPDARDTRQAMRRRIQMVFQDPQASLNPRWRVEAIVGEPIRAFGLASGRALAARVAGHLETVGLSAADARKYPHEFSGGQRQRIAIARALASEPEFIVCDEPTSALDVSVQAQVLNLLRTLQSDLGLTYLFISHDLAVVRHMAQRVGVLQRGILVEEADTKTFFEGPKAEYSQMLLSAVPKIRKGTDE